MTSSSLSVVVFVFWLSFLIIIAFATNERKERMLKKSLPPMKKKGNKLNKKKYGKTNKQTNVLKINNLPGVTTDGPSREREKGRERERARKYERDDAEICLDFCLFSFRARRASRVRVFVRLTTEEERKKERKVRRPTNFTTKRARSKLTSLKDEEVREDFQRVNSRWS